MGSVASSGQNFDNELPLRKYNNPPTPTFGEGRCVRRQVPHDGLLPQSLQQGLDGAQGQRAVVAHGHLSAWGRTWLVEKIFKWIKNFTEV